MLCGFARDRSSFHLKLQFLSGRKNLSDFLFFIIRFRLLAIIVGQKFPTRVISSKSNENSNTLFSLQLNDFYFTGMLVAAVSETPGSHIRKQVTQRNKQWCAVYTKPQKEEFAEVNLRLRGIETFFPKLFLPKSSKRKKRIVALFPNYIFVCVDFVADEYASIMWCPGVNRIVSFNGTPAIVDESIIAFLMGQVGANGVIAARCNIHVGQHVSIDGGPFDGLVGIIQEPPNARGRVKILLQLLNRFTNVDVPVQFIKASWVASESSLGD
jgi:transcriptional antiterminator RfaH